MAKKVKFYIAVATAIAAAAVPVGFLPALSAGASTAACGSSCTSPYNKSLGSGEVLAVSGNSVVMSAASTTNSGEDWTPVQEGDVANAVAAGVMSAKLDMLYSTDQLVEYQYAPAGAPSDQCLANTANVGIQGPPFYAPTLNVALAPCGITAQSLWILDASNEANGYVDLINAGYATTSSYDELSNSAANDYTYTSPFAEPTVLTVNSSGKVVLAPLSELGGVVSASQLWASWSAPAQPALRVTVAELRRKAAKSR